MKNKLERFVNTHRESFDSELPGDHVWDAIDTTPHSKGKLIQFFTRTRVAASLLVLVNAVVILVLLQRKPEANIAATPVATPTEQVDDKKEKPEQTIDQISRVVEIKQAALKEIESSNPFLYKKFTAAFSQLSSNYRELEKELATQPNKEALLEAMIQNLGLQQELLNQQLSIYQKLKQQKNEKVNKNI